ncbi:hypothetical protein [uncultured Stenotrophomonas sp.]|uniref:hypothetical protein n=1 Tax=uncultured Stenotrophomonas sp. TaxID=165438 RepID=UPI0025FBB8DD|nr:hypothetical protein [uncultured Stenotrophomonas sp.]
MNTNRNKDESSAQFVSAPRVVGVCSSGGHLVQMESLIKAGVSIDCVLSPDEVRVDVLWKKIPDCNLNSPLRVAKCSYRLFRLLLSVRPATIISTGAAPGGLALVMGRLLGSRTIWIDSIANAERASLTGKLVKPFANIWISQWEHVAKKEGGIYIGKIFRFFNSRDAASL